MFECALHVWRNDLTFSYWAILKGTEALQLPPRMNQWMLLGPFPYVRRWHGYPITDKWVHDPSFITGGNGPNTTHDNHHAYNNPTCSCTVIERERKKNCLTRKDGITIIDTWGNKKIIVNAISETESNIEVCNCNCNLLKYDKISNLR